MIPDARFLSFPDVNWVKCSGISDEVSVVNDVRTCYYGINAQEGYPEKEINMADPLSPSHQAEAGAESDRDQKKEESYLALHAFTFIHDGSVYYLIDKRTGDRTPIGSDDRGGRPAALKSAKQFVDKSLAERADLEKRAAAYREQVKR